jgi:hypothetical protein
VLSRKLAGLVIGAPGHKQAAPSRSWVVVWLVLQASTDSPKLKTDSIELPEAPAVKAPVSCLLVVATLVVVLSCLLLGMLEPCLLAAGVEPLLKPVVVSLPSEAAAPLQPALAAPWPTVPAVPRWMAD